MHLFSIFLFTAVLTAQPPKGFQSSEYEVKAAFIYNFVKFIEWPEGSKQADSDSIVIGILGQDPFGYIMEQVIGGKTVGGKTISIQRFKVLEKNSRCHVLFISRSEYPQLESIMSALSGSHTLTVGEIENFTDLGGMIYLYMDNKRIRFMINTESAMKSGLKISSKLLKLATAVHTASISDEINSSKIAGRSSPE